MPETLFKKITKSEPNPHLLYCYSAHPLTQRPKIYQTDFSFLFSCNAHYYKSLKTHCLLNEELLNHAMKHGTSCISTLKIVIPQVQHTPTRSLLVLQGWEEFSLTAGFQAAKAPIASRKRYWIWDSVVNSVILSTLGLKQDLHSIFSWAPWKLKFHFTKSASHSYLVDVFVPYFAGR